MDWSPIEKQISDATGTKFNARIQQNVGGGCINSAYRLTNGGQSFFVKLNSASQLDMFVAESKGLDEMAAASAVRVPKPVCCGTTGGQAYLVMENLNLGGRGGTAAMQQFGQQLAVMHRYRRSEFGWQRDNTIGSTPQPNQPQKDWTVFWREQRLGFQLRLAEKHGAGRSLLDKGERLMSDLDVFFIDYRPEPSLLHGDLWSGNYGITEQGEPVIFDPAVYFGDREADLAMTELFGGFGTTFYSAYDGVWPLDPGYAVRKTLYNLYHILNHFNLFGGGYAGQAEAMTDSLLRELA